MDEDKSTVTMHLMTALQATSYFSSLTDLRYEENEEEGTEYVIATFSNGNERKVNVHLDSGIALIKDVIRTLADGD